MATWQDRLKTYETDRNAAQKEIERAKNVYAQEKQSGASQDRLNQIHKWANQVRTASGISNNDSQYGNNSRTYTGMQNRNNQPVTQKPQPQNNTQSNNQLKSWNQPKQNNIPTYNPNTQIENRYLDQARRQSIYYNPNELFDGYYGGYSSDPTQSTLTNDQYREIAYYLQLQDQFSNNVRNAMNNEMDKGYGLTTNWLKNNPDVVEHQKNYYAIQDFLADKYEINGVNDNTIFGLSRADLGFNERGIGMSPEEDLVAKRLAERGVDWQSATDMALGRNGKTKHVLQNGEVIDTGEADNYRHSHASLYGATGAVFNDPRNQDMKFNWMNHIDPEALNSVQGQRTWDAQPIDYYYATNFILENNLLGDLDGDGTSDVPDNASYLRNMFDWRNNSHRNLYDTYSNPDADFDIQREIEKAQQNYQIQQLMNQRNQSANPQVQHLREVMASYGL